ncbi:MAG TPA: DUF58 domain-containing protein [Polyangiales bacterium]|nr:DUF58 domain-containing protein [Polyangiales bacterium]
MSDGGARSMIDPSFVERLEHLRFAVDGVVDGLHTGLHKSRRRGGGLVFAEHRDYRPGDDPRTLDWRAFARSDHHRVKRFEHEAQLRAIMALDISGSMAYGTGALVQSKIGFAATLLGASAEVLLRQGDAAGVALFHSQLARLIPARGGHAHARALMEVLATPATAAARTNLAQTFDELGERAGRQGALVIASDLLDFDEGALRGLNRLTARGHRVMVLHVLHEDELSLPFSEPLRFTGTEGEPALEADPRLLREAYTRELTSFRMRIKSTCAAAGARYVLASMERPMHEILREALAPDEGMRWG